jgi:hypothetical protein
MLVTAWFATRDIITASKVFCAMYVPLYGIFATQHDIEWIMGAAVIFSYFLVGGFIIVAYNKYYEIL